jgi:glyoxylase-like metal-dependent hydrolase (beta-lactamase superfamily II)
MSAGFASTTDLADKTISFDAIGPDLYAFTAEGDPNSGIIVGDDGVMVIDTQATPVMAEQVIARVKAVTDKPIKYVLLTHYHAVRVLGASAYSGAEILASAAVSGGGKHSGPHLAHDYVSGSGLGLARQA